MYLTALMKTYSLKIIFNIVLFSLNYAKLESFYVSHASHTFPTLFPAFCWIDYLVFAVVVVFKIYVPFHYLTLEKAMATHSSTLAWKIPWTEEPGGLQSTGSQRVGHDWATSLSLSLFESLSDWHSKFLFFSYFIFLNINLFILIGD